MNREEIMNLGFEELETRSSEIAEETKEADEARLADLNAELDAIEERKHALEEEAEQRRNAAQEVAEGRGLDLKPVIEHKEENKMEVRNTPEYMDAYVEYLKTGDDTECRALLTENADNGIIAVPGYVEDKINTAWESNEFLNRVRRTYFKGNLKVGYEVSADPAQIHNEGGAAITEENLDINYVALIPRMVKKMVRLSDEVMDLRGQVFIDYVFDEIEYQIVKLVGATLLNNAATFPAGAAPELVAVSTAAGASLTTADIIAAEGLLGAEATAPILFTTRATAAALKAAALSANYGYDPFDGLEVMYTDATTLGGKLAIIADPSAFQINLPNGDQVTFKFDDLTEAAADMVRIIGRLYAALGIVAPGRIVTIAAA